MPENTIIIRRSVTSARPSGQSVDSTPNVNPDAGRFDQADRSPWPGRKYPVSVRLTRPRDVDEAIPETDPDAGYVPVAPLYNPALPGWDVGLRYFDNFVTRGSGEVEYRASVAGSVQIDPSVAGVFYLTITDAVTFTVAAVADQRADINGNRVYASFAVVVYLVYAADVTPTFYGALQPADGIEFSAESGKIDCVVLNRAGGNWFLHAADLGFE